MAIIRISFLRNVVNTEKYIYCYIYIICIYRWLKFCTVKYYHYHLYFIKTLLFSTVLYFIFYRDKEWKIQNNQDANKWKEVKIVRFTYFWQVVWAVMLSSLNKIRNLHKWLVALNWTKMQTTSKKNFDVVLGKTKPVYALKKLNVIKIFQ